jgi:hypothetical protein
MGGHEEPCYAQHFDNLQNVHFFCEFPFSILEDKVVWFGCLAASAALGTAPVIECGIIPPACSHQLTL